MHDQDKTKEQLVDELGELRQRIAELEAGETERERAEEALRESEDRYRQLFEAESDAIFLIENETGRILEANNAASVLYGYSREDLLTKKNTDLSAEPEETRQVTQETPIIVDRVVTIPLRLHRKSDGTVFPVEITGRFFTWKERPVHIAAIRDITERRRAEELIRIQRDLGITLSAAPGLEETLRLCTEAAIRISGMDCGGVYLVDATTGDVALAFHQGLPSEFIERASHYAADSLNARLVMAGKPFYVRHHELPVSLDEGVRHEGLRALAVIPVHHEDRVIACLNVASHTLDEVPDSARTALETIATQIGSAIAHSKAQEALHQSQANLQTLFDSLEDFLFVLDMKGRILRVNPAMVKRLGYSEAELLGESILKVRPPDRHEEAAAIVADIVAGKVDVCRVPVIARDGTQIPVETRVTRGHWEDQEALFGVSRDITERIRAEEALRESEGKFRNLAEQSPNMIFINKRGKVVYANKRCEEMTGYTRDEFYSADFDFLTLIAPEHKESIKVSFSRHLKGKEVEPYEYAIVTKDGERMEVILITKLIEYEGERAILGTVTDITERKQVEEALRTEKEFTDTALDAQLDTFFLFEPATGKAVRWNRAFRDISGYTDEEIGRMPAPASYYSPEDLERVQAFTQRVLKEGIGTIELELIRKDGRKVPTEYRVSVINDDQGEPKYIISIGRDVTQHRQAEEERERLLARIREQARRTQQIVDTVPEGVLLLDADRHIVLANPVAQKDLPALADAAVGDALTRLGDRPLAELLTSPPRGLWHEVVADGRVFQAIARPIEDDATPTGWVLVIRDVTQQREIQRRVQQQERLAAVGQLAAGVAHDFNNIMATVVLYAQMTARMEGLPAAVQERMETIDGQAKHATNLIQQILDFSRRAVLERRPLDLAPLLKEHVRLLGRTLPESIEIRLDYEPDAYVIDADPTRMQQMVTNLALNARDAMPRGGELRIGLERIVIKPGESPLLPEMAAGEWITVAVSDTGTGIPPDVLPHIFEPFFTTRAPLGSGLGLAQVHGIVGQHGGRIDVDTQVGEGTTFTIYLPVHSLAPLPLRSRAELPALPTGGGETILVVEDDAVVRKALADSLELLDYQVLEVSNGGEALETLEQRRGEVALVLSDVVMPQMGGIALLHALRERGLAVPMVMLTGHPIQREMEELRAQGMADWLPKPPRLEQLAEAVARALGAD